MSKTSPNPINFEDSITKLNQLIEQLEKGNLSLEKSLINFEQGIQLIRQCQTILNEAEQKVEILSKQHTQELLEPYVHPTDENS